MPDMTQRSAHLAVAMLFLGPFAGLAIPQSHDAESKAAAAASAAKEPAGQPEQNESARPGASRSADQPEADVAYDVSGESPAELLKSIETVARAPAYSVEQLQRKCQALIDGAERILEAGPDDRQALEAIEWRFSALDALARYGDGAAQARLQKLVEQLNSDERPKIAAAARRYDLQRRAAKLADLSAEKQQAFLEEVFDYFDANPATALNIDILLATGQILADRGDPQVALDAYKRFRRLALASGDPDMAYLARTQFDTMIQRLELVGQKLEVKGETLGGEPFSLDEYKGKVVLVDFWATWCGPCLEEMPNLKANYETFHGRGFEIVGVNVDQNRESVEAMLEQFDLPWKTLFSDDPRYEGHGHPVAARYGIEALPTLLLLDQTGKVISVTARGPRLEAWLTKLLGPSELPERSPVDK